MKIVVALDSFKGTLDSKSACEIVKDAFLSVNASLDIVIKPVADGGEGTAQALIAASGGQWIPCHATGPLPHMTVDAGYAWFENTRTALVEMASASGLTLVDSAQRNPLLATTFGTGQLINACLNKKPKRILLAVGGSATVDGGIGMAAALGWRFLNSDGIQVAFGGRNLSDITKIIPPSPPLKLPRTEVLCDVTNPLTGPSGAACVFGPQKGASPEMVQILDNGLAHLAALVRSQLKMEIETVPGSGAAGGLAAGAIAFLGAKLVPGIETVIAASSLETELDSADWIITGEGSFDSQSLNGKVVSGVSRAAKRKNVRVGVLAGQVALAPDQYKPAGIDDALPCRQPDMPLDYALANAPSLLAAAARLFAQKHLI